MGANDIKFKEFKMPQPLLKQLNECCSDGFVLIASNDGSPRVYVSFCSDVSALGLMSFTQMWANSAAKVNQDINLKNMTNGKD